MNFPYENGRLIGTITTFMALLPDGVDADSTSVGERPSLTVHRHRQCSIIPDALTQPCGKNFTRRQGIRKSLPAKRAPHSLTEQLSRTHIDPAKKNSLGIQKIHQNCQRFSQQFPTPMIYFLAKAVALSGQFRDCSRLNAAHPSAQPQQRRGSLRVTSCCQPCLPCQAGTAAKALRRSAFSKAKRTVPAQAKDARPLPHSR